MLKDLTSADWVFLVSALIGGTVFLLRLLLMLVGLHHGGAEAGQMEVGHAEMGGVDVGHADLGHVEAGQVEVAPGDVHAESDVSFTLLSIQGITAFFMMFGLVGLALHRESRAATGWSVLGAVAAGAVALCVINAIFMVMRRLQSSGTLDLRQAVGQEGSVYLTIPPGGTGKVQVTVQGRFQVFDAASEANQAIKTGERVKVVKIVSGNILVVKTV